MLEALPINKIYASKNLRKGQKKKSESMLKKDLHQFPLVTF